MNTQRPSYVVGFMVCLAAVFGSGVTGIYLGASDTLRRNAEFQRQRSLVQVFGLGDPQELSKARVAELIRDRLDDTEEGKDPETGWTFRLLKVYRDESRSELQAYGFPFRGPGFWGPIEGVLAVDPTLTRTIGIAILRQSETPGLGGRIVEPVFTEQFRRGILIGANPRGEYLKVSAPDPAAGPRQVDAITGATQTSMAMDRLLNECLARFHRAMAARRAAESETALNAAPPDA